jgi:hypothetical protein
LPRSLSADAQSVVSKPDAGFVDFAVVSGVFTDFAEAAGVVDASGAFAGLALSIGSAVFARLIGLAAFTGFAAFACFTARFFGFLADTLRRLGKRTTPVDTTLPPRLSAIYVLFTSRPGCQQDGNILRYSELS